MAAAIAATTFRSTRACMPRHRELGLQFKGAESVHSVYSLVMMSFWMWGFSETV